MPKNKPPIKWQESEASLWRLSTGPRIVIARSEATWESREGSADSYNAALKWYAPIASVAAFPERHWQLQIYRQYR